MLLPGEADLGAERTLMFSFAATVSASRKSSRCNIFPVIWTDRNPARSKTR